MNDQLTKLLKREVHRVLLILRATPTKITDEEKTTLLATLRTVPKQNE